MSLRQRLVYLLQLILFLIVLISPCVYIYQTAQKPVANLINHTEIFGLSQIPTEEIWSILAAMNLNNRKFIQINAQDIKKRIKEHPLVHRVKVRALLFPRIHYEIYIWEEDAWAIHNKQIYNQRCEPIVNPSSKFFFRNSVQKIYDDFSNHKLGSVIAIQSNRPLNKRELKQIQKLSLESQYILNLITKDSLKAIIIDNDSNLIIEFHKIKLIFGPINESINKRLLKLRSSLLALQKVLKQQAIEYIDLSLDTEDVLLGKATQRESSNGEPLSSQSE